MHAVDVGGRNARTVASLLAMLVLAGALVGGLAKARVQTDLHAFLPSGDPSVKQYDRLAAEYGGDPIAVLIETRPAKALFQADAVASLLRLEGGLSNLDGVKTVYGPATMLNQVAGQTQDLLAELAGRRDAEIQLASAKAKLRGASPSEITAAGIAARDKFDARYGPLVVQGLPGGAPTLRNGTFIDRVLFSGSQVRPQWRFVVPNTRAATILIRPNSALDANETAALVERVRAMTGDLAPKGATVSVSGAPVLVAAMSDTVSRDVPRLGAFAIALVALVLAAGSWVRRSRRWAPLGITAVAMLGTVAVFGWLDRPLSMGVVAFGTVLLGVGCYYPSYVTVGAPRRTVLVVASATSASLATLAFSPIPLVRDLGLALAIGVLLAALLSLAVGRWLTAGLAVPEGLKSSDLRSIQSRLSPRGAAAVLAVAIVGAGVGWFHLGDLKVRADIAEFAGGMPAYAQARHVSDVLGSSSELAIVVRGADVTTPEALEWQSAAQDQAIADHGDRLRLVVSAPSLLRFLGSDPTAEQIQAALRILPTYLTQSAITPDGGSAVISFGVQLEQLNTLRAVVADLERLSPPDGYTAEVVGLPVVALRSETLLGNELLAANGFGILVSGVVLALGLRRRADALRAIGAAAIATGIGFLILWATGVPLNPITASLGALTAAAGCEFTVVQAEARRTVSRLLRRAVLLGVAMSVAGYAVLISSGLHAVRDLGITLAGATILAVSASWVVVQATSRANRPAPQAPRTMEPINA